MRLRSPGSGRSPITSAQLEDPRHRTPSLKPDIIPRPREAPSTVVCEPLPRQIANRRMNLETQVTWTSWLTAEAPLQGA